MLGSISATRAWLAGWCVLQSGPSGAIGDSWASIGSFTEQHDTGCSSGPGNCRKANPHIPRRVVVLLVQTQSVQDLSCQRPLRGKLALLFGKRNSVGLTLKPALNPSKVVPSAAGAFLNLNMLLLQKILSAQCLKNNQPDSQFCYYKLCVRQASVSMKLWLGCKSSRILSNLPVPESTDTLIFQADSGTGVELE